MNEQKSNFHFLQNHAPLLAGLAGAAEISFWTDPNTTLMKLRQLGEAMAQHIARQLHISADSATPQFELLGLLQNSGEVDRRILSIFHHLRKEGNKAIHQFETRHKEAADCLMFAWDLCIWFHNAFGNSDGNFNPGAYPAPPDPSQPARELRGKIERMQAELSQAQDQLQAKRELARLAEEEKAQQQALLASMDAERQRLHDQLAAQEAELARLRAEKAQQDQQAEAEQAAQSDDERAQQQRQLRQAMRRANQNLQLDEATTRRLIDRQLEEAGWEDVDSQMNTYAQGARPQKGKNTAIAEWPVKGREKADYVLFCGLIPVAVVEAKKANINVAGKIDQAERYARNWSDNRPEHSAWAYSGRTIAWPDAAQGHYHIPFAYSCNGRPYIAQLAEQSGTWFRDLRHPSNQKRALHQFHSPEGLLDLLKRDRAQAEAALAQEPFGYLGLRDYQQKAVMAVEAALAQNQRRALLAMATGTGKTRTIIGLIYRFLKSQRFRRILFLVDRLTLGEQAKDGFSEALLEQNQTLMQIYTVNTLDDSEFDKDAHVQIATVQTMASRIFGNNNNNNDAPTIDHFDCIIVDEAHRGYTLDQEMTEGEIAIRDGAQYLSVYRRVLDYFDAVKIGLTATPAKHTSEIFGNPVYTYSYREAVIDGWLIDHEPPIRYQTLLSQNGIHFDSGDTVHVINTRNGRAETALLEDEMQFDVAAFNRRVINENFNRVICRQLAEHELDPFGEEKTLIFCATDLHADMVKRLLDEAFYELHGQDYPQAAVAKITGQSDNVSALVKQYKNERYPNIAITVDLLTTGIDVEEICHLVFMRRVKSRILFEQMLGRATRLCPEIGKTRFRIYDPVDIYAALSEVNTMQAVVKDPNVSLEQLWQELTDPTLRAMAEKAPGEGDDANQAETVFNQLQQKIKRVVGQAAHQAENKPELKQRYRAVAELWGMEPTELPGYLHQIGLAAALDFFARHPDLPAQIDSLRDIKNSRYGIMISEHADVLQERSQSYGQYQRPEDYLESFERFIREHINQNAALMAVVNRPRDLTRAQLREIQLLLTEAGYSEVNLQTAVLNQSNQDIAAGIIAHIRRAALGEPLIPFAQRVDMAMQHIYASRPWTQNQRQWLARLAKQLVNDMVLDREFVNQHFAQDGGAKRLERMLGQDLDQLLEQLNTTLWPQSA